MARQDLVNRAVRAPFRVGARGAHTASVAAVTVVRPHRSSEPFLAPGTEKATGRVGGAALPAPARKRRPCVGTESAGSPRSQRHPLLGKTHCQLALLAKSLPRPLSLSSSLFSPCRAVLALPTCCLARGEDAGRTEEALRDLRAQQTALRALQERQVQEPLWGAVLARIDSRRGE